MYKVYHGLSPDFITQLFPLNDHEKDTRKKSFFRPRRIFSTCSGSESISFLGPKIWKLVPDNIKATAKQTILETKMKLKHHCQKSRKIVTMQGI